MGQPTVTLQFDAENRLVRYTVSGAIQELYDYDGLGNRVRYQHQVWNASGSTWVTAATTNYVYDAFGELAAEYGGNPSVNSPCVTCYITTDMLGSTRLATDETGAAVARFDYYPLRRQVQEGE
jgi:YD repeat-containing protein